MLHEIAEARTRDAWEWERLRDLEAVDSYRWGELNALAHLRRSLDRGDFGAAQVWAYVVRQCREAEVRAIEEGLREINRKLDYVLCLAEQTGGPGCEKKLHPEGVGDADAPWGR